MLRAERCALYAVLPLLFLLAAPGWAATMTTADTGQVQFVSATELFSSAQSGAFGPATFADVPASFWSYRHIEYLAAPAAASSAATTTATTVPSTS